jgi:uncharacterized protein YceK
MLLDASSREYKQREGGCVAVRQGHLIVVVGTFLIGCAVLLLMVGCAGTMSSEAPQEGQGHTDATKKEQTRSPEATASEEEARYGGTRTYDYQNKDAVWVFTTNDIPGCPKGGLLKGTDKRDWLDGKDGKDKVRGLGGSDNLYGRSGNDILYGGPDDDYEMLGGRGDDVLHGGHGDDALEAARKSVSAEGDDVLYGGDGVDYLSGIDEGKDVLYGGDGNDMLLRTVAGVRTSSIAVKDGTDTIPTRTTMSLAAAR